MSTKGHILFSTYPDNGSIEAYNETSEAHHNILKKFVGFNVYMLLDSDICEIEIKKYFANIKILKDVKYEIGELKKEFRIDLNDVFEIIIDNEGTMFGFTGGSKSANLNFDSIGVVNE